VPWKFRPLDPIERENDALKTTIVCLRRELENKQGAVGRLKTLLHQRSNTIDELNGTIDALRAANQKLNAEAEHLADIIRSEQPQLDAAMLAPK
jgi:chromosome segregation ATPase